jgi:hypothetical protein
MYNNRWGKKHRKKLRLILLSLVTFLLMLDSQAPDIKVVAELVNYRNSEVSVH